MVFLPYEFVDVVLDLLVAQTTYHRIRNENASLRYATANAY